MNSPALPMDEQPFQPATAWRITGLLWLFMVVNFVDKIVVGLVAVPIMDEFKLTPGEFGIVASCFFWFFSIACVVGGFMANRFSTKWLLMGMALIWSAAQLPVIYATSIGMIVAARVLLGIGEGPAAPVAVHATYKWFPSKRRNLPTVIINQGSAIGIIVGGLLIPRITAAWGWRVNFVLLGLVGLVWCVLWLVWGKEGPLVVSDAEDGARDASTTAALAQSTQRIPYAKLLTNPCVVAIIFAHFSAYWALALVLTWLPTYLQKGLGFNPLVSGQIFSAVALTSVPVCLVLSWWSQKRLTQGQTSRSSRGVMSSVCLIIAGLLFLVLWQLPLATGSKVIVLTAAASLPSIMFSLGFAAMSEIAPPLQRGAMLSIENGIATTAAIFAPMVSGWLIDGTPGAAGFEQGYALNGALLLIGGTLGLLLINPEKAIAQLRGQAAPV